MWAMKPATAQTLLSQNGGTKWMEHIVINFCCAQFQLKLEVIIAVNSATVFGEEKKVSLV